jgi:endonuclease YncB( thermonuclease family)
VALSSDLGALPFQMTKYGNIRRAGKSGTRPRRDRLLVIIIVLACLFALYAFDRWNTKPDAVISGKSWVIDGGTISISSTRIRLEGIDAPETDQTCVDANGKNWLCGKIATRELKDYVRGQDLTCKPRAFDRFKRVLAVCFLPDGSDINAWMVQQGWALASGFARIYESEEAEAKAAKRGIWAGSFIPPWEWRRNKPT